MSRELAYSRSVRPEFRTYLANGLASWLAPRLSINRRFPLTSSPSVEVLSAAERSRVPNTNGRNWLSCCCRQPQGVLCASRANTNEVGLLQYLAAWDVRRGRVMGRCEAQTGIESFSRLVEQLMRTEPYRSANRVSGS